MDLTVPFRRQPSFEVTRVGSKGLLACADALQFMGSLRSDVADVVFIDPPFNLGKDYGISAGIENAEPEVYERYMRSLLREASRVIIPGGALFLYHLPYWASRLSIHLQSCLEFRHWIAIAMRNGFVRGHRLYPAHYALLYYTKGAPGHFARPRLSAQRCRHCGKLIKDYGGYRSIIDAKGINLSDFWDDLSPVRHSAHKMRAANQLPERLTDRVMEIAGFQGGVVVDPFMGTGTSLVSAARMSMSVVGNDIAPDCVSIARERLERLLQPDPG